MTAEERHEIQWNGKRMKFLRTQLGINVNTFASAVNLNPASIKNYEKGNMPSIPIAAVIAEYFQVPIEYFLKPSDIEEDKVTIQNIRNIQRLSYETWLKTIPRRLDFPGKPIAPWPYNLVNAIFDTWDEILTDDQIEGINIALEKLTEREKKLILMYYQDYMTFEQIGNEISLTPNRIQQIIHKAVRKIRHPSRSKLIMYGAHKTTMTQIQFEDRVQELLRKEKQLQDAEAEFQEKLKKASMPPHPDITLNPNDTSIDELNLSVRSYNCLHRANIKTYRELCDAAEKGDLVRIRNLGTKSLNEILTVLRDKLGMDYFGIYASSPYINA